MLILIFKIETKILWIASWDQDWRNPSLLNTVLLVSNISLVNEELERELLCALAYCN